MALPCRCARGHAYTETDAENNEFKCPKDGLQIVCDPKTEDAPEKEARAKPAAAGSRKRKGR